MKDIPIRFSDVIEDLNNVDVVYYLDEVNNAVHTAFVIKVIDNLASIMLTCNQIVNVELDSRDNCWYFGGNKLHIIVIGE